MHTFEFVRPADSAAAVVTAAQAKTAQQGADVRFVAGGTNRTSAPCCAVFACAAVAIAAAGSAGRMNSKVCIETAPARG